MELSVNPLPRNLNPISVVVDLCLPPQSALSSATTASSSSPKTEKEDDFASKQIRVEMTRLGEVLKSLEGFRKNLGLYKAMLKKAKQHLLSLEEKVQSIGYERIDQGAWETFRLACEQHLTTMHEM